MVTYPGLPAPVIGTHLSREAAEGLYAPGVTFQIGQIEICTNTGTYLDVPFHRYEDGHDLTELSLDRVAGVPAVCLDRTGEFEVSLTEDDLAKCGGNAVLIRSNGASWATETRTQGRRYLINEHTFGTVATPYGLAESSGLVARA